MSINTNNLDKAPTLTKVLLFTASVYPFLGTSSSKNRIGEVIVSVLASNVMDYGFESRLDLNKDYKIGVCCCLSVKHTTLRSKSKYWLARNQDNMSAWSDMSTRGLLFP
jgi:hypothetical protein